jgi:hypothetical protein
VATASVEQLRVCERAGVDAVAVSDSDIAGVAANARDSTVWPMNGLRHRPKGETSGWYLWAGEELRAEDDFFAPLHIAHLSKWRPEALPYLALPPGWRFLIAPGYEDLWYDEALLAYE